MSIEQAAKIRELEKRLAQAEETIRELQTRVGWYPVDHDRKTLTLPKKSNA